MQVRLMVHKTVSGSAPPDERHAICLKRARGISTGGNGTDNQVEGPHMVSNPKSKI